MQTTKSRPPKKGILKGTWTSVLSHVSDFGLLNSVFILPSMHLRHKEWNQETSLRLKGPHCSNHLRCHEFHTRAPFSWDTLERKPYKQYDAYLLPLGELTTKYLNFFTFRGLTPMKRCKMYVSVRRLHMFLEKGMQSIIMHTWVLWSLICSATWLTDLHM